MSETTTTELRETYAAMQAAQARRDAAYKEVAAADKECGRADAAFDQARRAHVQDALQSTPR